MSKKSKAKKAATLVDTDDEEMQLLSEKHKLETEEMKLKQQRETLNIRMRRANLLTGLVHDVSETTSNVTINTSQPKPNSTPLNSPTANPASDEDANDLLRLLKRGQEQQCKLVASLNMPKVELQTFDGNPLQYWSFMRLFQTTVSSDLDDTSKLTRLLQYTTGKAKRAIQGCAIMEPADGYTEALRLLKARFGSNDAITNAWVTKIVEGSPIRLNDNEGLRDYADDLQTCYAILDSIGETREIDHQEAMKRVMMRLPPFLQNRWRKQVADYRRDDDRKPRFKDLMKFVLAASEEVNDPVYGQTSKYVEEQADRSANGNSKQAAKSKPKHLVVKAAYASCSDETASAVCSTASVQPGSCILCSGGHELQHCDRLRQMNQSDQYQVTKQYRLCRLCLKPGHRAKDCRSGQSCSKCKKKHHDMFHEDRGINKVAGQQAQAANNTINSYAVASYSDRGQGQSTTVRLHPVLPIVPVIVKSCDGRYKLQTHAMLDSGSTSTFCTQELADMLHLQGTDTTIRMSTVDQILAPTKVKLVTFRMSDLEESNDVIVKDVFAKPNMNIIVETISSNDLAQWPHLNGVPICDMKGARVHVIVGQDLPDLLRPRDVRSGPEGSPYAVNTLLGWTMNGPLKEMFTNTATNNVSVHYVQEGDERDHALSDLMERFWKVETAATNDDRVISQTDKRVMREWDSNVTKEGCHYVLPIPLKDKLFKAEAGLLMAERRLQGLKNRLNKDNDLKLKYIEAMEDMFRQGYAEKVPDSEVKVDKVTTSHYLPHHPVVNSNKDKIRIVFDCAAKDADGQSLNDKAWSGPDLTNRLLGVLLRFRQEPVALAADITAMFHQVLVPSSQRDMLRFLWWEGGNLDSKPIAYRMRVHLFGGTWSPSCASYALRRLAIDHLNDENEQACRAIERNFYVDDFMSSVPTEKDARRLAKQMNELLQRGGFKLCKWICNSRAVLETIPPELRAASVKDMTDKSMVLPCERTLGLRWDVEQDAFKFQVSVQDKPHTRRGVLSATCSIYDPCGMLSPFILRAKLINQDLVRLKIGWDEPIPQQIEAAWMEWKHELKSLVEFQVKRAFKPIEFGSVRSCQLVHFADASQRAYGAVTYVRTVDDSNRVHCAFVAATSHLAPIRQLTVPRLELMAAVCAAKQDNWVKNETDMELQPSVFFSDSAIVLYYLANDDKRYSVFVANRITTILNVSTSAQWHHVPTELNPADDLSRGLSAGDIIANERWLKGPSFMQSRDAFDHMINSNARPAVTELSDVVLDKVSTHATDVTHTQERNVISLFFERYSKWTRLRRAVCWLHKFVHYLRIKRGKIVDTQQRSITVSDMESAERAIARCVQREVFGSPESHHVQVMKSMSQLSPTLNVDKLLVVGGRLGGATMPDDIKHPIIMPRNHYVTSLIIRHYYEQLGHAGIELTMTTVRERYWILQFRHAVKNIVTKCVTCRKMTHRACVQKMADLPEDRIAGDEPPFTRTGVDFFGPFLIKQGRSSPKRYGCLFTCLQTRAIHLELAYSLDASSFINCLQRFVCRRGNVRTIRCDNGTNFTAAERELREALNDMSKDDVERYLVNHSIEWVFNTPSASHMGGVWERMIRTTRRVLQALLPEQRLDDEGLSTLFCRVEYIVNSRPLTYVSSDARDLQPITPNDLLQLRSPAAFPAGIFDPTDVYSRRRWRQICYMAGVFWARWRKEYLLALQVRHKWHNVRNNVKEGDVVLVLDEDAAKQQWALGRIVSVRHSADGLVRSVTVRTARGVYERPIVKLCLLEEATL